MQISLCIRPLSCCTSARPCVTVQGGLDTIEEAEIKEPDPEPATSVKKTETVKCGTSDNSGIIPPPPTWGRSDP